MAQTEGMHGDLAVQRSTLSDRHALNQLVKFGLLAPLIARPDKDLAISEFLNAGYDIALSSEPQTIHWFGLKYTGVEPSTFAIFDTFTAESGRTAHLSGKVAEALMENAPKLLSPTPHISQLDVLASKVTATTGGGRTSGLSVGLRVVFEAKLEKVDTVREFLIVSHDHRFIGVGGGSLLPVNALERAGAGARRSLHPRVVCHSISWDRQVWHRRLLRERGRSLSSSEGGNRYRVIRES